MNFARASRAAWVVASTGCRPGNSWTGAAAIWTNRSVGAGEQVSMKGLSRIDDSRQLTQIRLPNLGGDREVADRVGEGTGASAQVAALPGARAGCGLGEPEVRLDQIRGRAVENARGRHSTALQ